MRNIKKLLSVLLMLTVLVSFFGLTASAADNDPNMTAYNGQFTYVVNRGDIPLGGTTLDIYAVPANSSFIATTFATDTAAANVVWTRTDGSTAGITKGAVSASAISGGYASCLTVNLAGLMAHGPASFRATNPLTGGYVDITVIVTVAAYNDYDGYFTPDVECLIFDPNDNLYEDTADYIYADNHIDGRSYVTVLDGLVEMENLGLVDSFVESYGYVSSITIDGTPYAASGMDGWQYRVYEDDDEDGTYDIVPISEMLGAGDMILSLLDLEFDMVQWRYGSFYDSSLFPTTYTP